MKRLIFWVFAAWAVFITVFALKPDLLPIGRASADTGVDDGSVASAIEVQEAFRRISAEVLPSIVEVAVEAQPVVPGNEDGEIPWNDFFADPSEESRTPRYFRSQGLGSGIIVEQSNDTRYVLTNAHVVGTTPDKISIELHDGSILEAELVGVDMRKDLALLRFESDDPALHPINLGDSDRLYVGDWVLAFGSPYGYEQSVSAGIVSALGRRDGPGDNINDFIQTDAAINQGNSGGALVNIHGELVGINTFITTPNGGSIGLGFAVPINNAVTSFRQLIDSGEIRYGWMGISLGQYGPEAAESMAYPENGVMVFQVFGDSPAADAGLEPGDRVLELDGRPIIDSEHLIYRIGDKAPGEAAVFVVDRFGENIELTAILGERAGEASVRALHGEAYPGFVAAPLTDDIKMAMNLVPETNGAAVAEVYPRTLAQIAGLRAGDIITSIGEYEIVDLKSMYKALNSVDRNRLEFTVIREGSTIRLSPKEDQE